MEYDRQLCNLYELPEEWQKEAISNHGEDCEDITYAMPLPEDNPEIHALIDMSQCMRSTGTEQEITLAQIPIDVCNRA